ncbi:MAG: hypothetical protein ABIZ07_03850 [Dermatophilaceae bacterium]
MNETAPRRRGEADLDRLRRARPSRTARLIAGALTPANVVLALMADVSLTHSSTWLAGAGWWLITLVLMVAAPYAILFRAIRSGRVSDRQVVRRDQRPWLFAAAAGCVALALAVLAFAGAPRALVALVVAMLAGLAVMGAITLVWKASLHLAVASGAVAVLAIENHLAGAIAALALPVLGWARWREGRHSVAQVIGGGVIGAVVAAAAFILVR